jgi:hypothetical protein
MRALVLYTGESNFLYRPHSEQRLLVAGHQSLHTLRRRVNWRIVDLLGTFNLNP